MVFTPLIINRLQSVAVIPWLIVAALLSSSMPLPLIVARAWRRGKYRDYMQLWLDELWWGCSVYNGSNKRVPRWNM